MGSQVCAITGSIPPLPLTLPSPCLTPCSWASGPGSPLQSWACSAAVCLPSCLYRPLPRPLEGFLQVTPSVFEVAAALENIPCPLQLCFPLWHLVLTHQVIYLLVCCFLPLLEHELNKVGVRGRSPCCKPSICTVCPAHGRCSTNVIILNKITPLNKREES